MGMFLSSIREDWKALTNLSPGWSEPLERVKEYHGIFKSVCETFAIRKEEFAQIFGSTRKLELLDREKTGIVNALEVFCGMVFYAREATWRDKLKMLFTLFDFNQIKSISIVDLEYMMLCICNFTYKVLEKNAKANQLEIAKWLTGKLNPKLRINVTSLNTFCLQSTEVTQFFKLAGINLGSPPSLSKGPIPIEAEQDINLQRQAAQIKSKLSWLNGISEKTTRCKSSKELPNYHCKIEWVYGIRLEGIRRPFLLHQSSVIYSIGSLMVVYYHQQNQQQIYNRHTRNVTAFCLNSKKRIVASAEGKNKAQIYLWDVRTLATQTIISLLHKCSIHLINFLAEDSLLATTGDHLDSPMLIYQLEGNTARLRYSFKLGSPLLDMIPFFSLIAANEVPMELLSTFVCFSKSIVFIVEECSDTDPHTTPYQYTDSTITCGSAVYANTENTYLRLFCHQSTGLYVLTGHENGSVRSLLYMFEGELAESWDEIIKLNDSIACLQTTCSSIVVGCASEVRIYPICCLIREDKEEGSRVIQLNEHITKGLANCIQFLNISGEMIMACTTLGDCVRIGARQLQFVEGAYRQVETVNYMNTLIRLRDQLGPMCYFESFDFQMLLVAVKRNVISQIDPVTHQVQSVWKLQEDSVIVVVDAAQSDEKVCFVVCGCKSGRLLTRLDWEENPRVYDCGAEILTAKISKDTSYLLVATNQNYLLFFSQVNRVFSSLRKLHFQNQSPLSINFLDNYTFFTVGTSAKNMYLVEIPSLKHRNVNKELETITLSTFDILYPDDANSTRAVLGGDMKYYLAGLCSGTLLFFENMSELSNRSYTTLRTHKCVIANLIVSQHRQNFFSLGKHDQMLVQWRAAGQSQTFSKHFSKAYALTNEEDDRFTLMKQLSIDPKPSQYLLNVEYLFKGTRIDKLNECLRDSVGVSTSEMSGDEGALQKRRDNVVLNTQKVYGFNYSSANIVKYYFLKQANQLCVGFITSRFLIFQQISNAEQHIFETTNVKISCFGITQSGDIIFSEAGLKPKIHLLKGTHLHERATIQTNHESGIIHFALHQDFILSYAVAKHGYSMNLHDFRTGQLLAEKSTNLKIFQFMMLSETDFVSLHEIRRWQSFTASAQLGLATAGAILPNGTDVCLGGANGDLLVLSPLGMFVVVDMAHEGAISVVHVRKQEGKFQIITAGQDKIVNVWTSTFQQKISIDLKINGFEHSKFIKDAGSGYVSQDKPTSRVFVHSIDTYNEKMLLVFAHGEAYEISLTLVQKKQEEKNSFTDSIDSINQDSLPRDNHRLSMEQMFSYEIEKKKLIEAHCSSQRNALDRYTAFDVHSSLPLLVSAGNDGRLIFRHIETDCVLANYQCQNYFERIKAVRFSPIGKMIVVGLKSGAIMTFLMSLDASMSSLQIVHFQTFKQKYESQIIALKFSECSNYFAASFLPDRETGKAVINIYKIKNEKNQNIDQAFYVLKEALVLKQDEKKSQKYVRCAWSLNFVATSDQIYLISYEQYVGDLARPISDSKSKYSVYSITQNNFLTDQFSIDFTDFDYSRSVNVKLLALDSSKISQEYQLTALKAWDSHVVYGSCTGKLHIVKRCSLSVAQAIADVKTSEMCLSRTYCSHTSAICQIELSSCRRFLFVSSYSDECILKYQVIEEDCNVDCDYTAYPIQIKDDHGQFPTRDKFYQIINNIQPLRQEISDMLEDVERDDSPKIALSLCKAFGRRAQDHRGNMASFRGNLIYTLGPNIIIQSSQEETKQELISADPSLTSHQPQISTFYFNKGLMILATQEERSRLFVWDISFKHCVACMRVDFAFVYTLLLCGDSYAVLYGINDRFQLGVQLVNWKKETVLGRTSFPHSGNWKIKGLCLYMQESQQLCFVSCGYQHLVFWEMRGDELVHSSFFGVPIATNFLVVRSINESIVTGCESGNIYLWQNFQLAYIFDSAHSAAIRSMEVHEDVIVTGSKDGSISLTKLKKDKITLVRNIRLEGENQRLISLSKIEEKRDTATYALKYQVQAISLEQGVNKLIVGTRSGDIYQLKIEQSEKIQIKQCVYSLQEEEIVSVAFSKWEQKRFYTLTKSGLIQIWCLDTYKQLLSYHLKKEARRIYACKNYLLICCKKDVTALEIGQNNMFYPVPAMCLKMGLTNLESEEQQRFRQSGQITAFCLSNNENYLALAVSQSTSCSLINVYEMETSKVICKLNNLKHEIEYLDFSMDHKYVLFKDRYEEIGLLNLQNFKRINTIFVEMKIEWQQEGLRISPQGQQIYYSYNCQNKITTLNRLKHDKLVVGDQMGTIRIFDYPSLSDRLGELHLQCYTFHMNHVNNIVVHPSLPYLLSTALYDKSLILWKIVDI